MKLGLLAAIALMLTLFTQVGGVIFLVLMGFLVPLWRLLSKYHRGLAWLVTGPLFVTGYVWISMSAVPPLAAQFGREALPCWDSNDRGFGPARPWLCLASRNYADREVVGFPFAPDLCPELGGDSPGVLFGEERHAQSFRIRLLSTASCRFGSGPRRSAGSSSRST